MKKDLPHYKITIDEEYSEDGRSLGIDMIAFTAKPAIITKGFAFSQDEVKKLFFTDALKYRICAPVMIPMEIYRCDSNEEYYVQFTESEIELMHQKFMSNLTNTNIFNLEHNSTDIVPAYVLEAWIVETPETDKSFMTYGINVPKGTLMMTTQITDKEVYNKLIEEGQVGYSIEGFLGLKLSEIKLSANPPFHEDCKCSKVNGVIKNESDACEYCLEQSQFNIEIKNESMKEQKFNELLLLDNTTTFFIDGEVAVGSKVYYNYEEIKLIDGVEVKCRSIIYGDILVINDGRILTLSDGTIVSIESPKDEFKTKNKEEKMENKLNLPAGEYTDANGNCFIVAEDGTVTAKEAQLEAEPAPVEPVDTKLAVEPAPVVPADTNTAVDTYTKEELDAKLEEIYKVIADLKAEDVKEDAAEPVDPTKLSIHERFAQFNKFFVNAKVEL